eukprot:GHVU01073016.1.p2 GENE.GHVU01073016.1~~GHVU01073016.1.p2  ORF type:complete len:138 (+),score=3.75 GHVU01073016.1:771-1184(+)
MFACLQCVWFTGKAMKSGSNLSPIYATPATIVTDTNTHSIDSPTESIPVVRLNRVASNNAFCDVDCACSSTTFSDTSRVCTRIHMRLSRRVGRKREPFKQFHTRKQRPRIRTSGVWEPLNHKRNKCTQSKTLAGFVH